MKNRIKNKIRSVLSDYVREDHIEECVDGIYRLISDYIAEIGLLRSLIIFRNFRLIYNKLFLKVKNVIGHAR